MISVGSHDDDDVDGGKGGCVCGEVDVHQSRTYTPEK